MAVRFANLSVGYFSCPYCKAQLQFKEDQIDADGVTCRSCKQVFLPVVFEKNYLRCETCNKRLEQVNYRQAGRVLRLCRDCSSDYDEMVSEFLSRIPTDLRARRKLKQSPSLVEAQRRETNNTPRKRVPPRSEGWGWNPQQRRIHYWTVPGVKTLCGQVLRRSAEYRAVFTEEIRAALQADPLGSSLPLGLCKTCYGLIDIEGVHRLVEDEGRWSCSCGVKFDRGYIPDEYSAHRDEIEAQRQGG